MGFKLAETIKKQLDPKALASIDVVIPIPETSNTSARCVATRLGKELVDGFIKNRYVFRTFIMPNQKLRRTGVRKKLNAMQPEFKNRNVLLVDDSIVRGTTSKEIVQMAREAGAKKVFFASCAPEITHAHIYGIDLASSSELIAYHKSRHQIAQAIGADAVIFQSLPDLEAACAELSPRDPATQKFEVGVFCGKYVTPVEEGYFEHLEALRSGRERQKVQHKTRTAIAHGLADLDELKGLGLGLHPVPSPGNGNANGNNTNGNGAGLYIGKEEKGGPSPLTAADEIEAARGGWNGRFAEDNATAEAQAHAQEEAAATAAAQAAEESESNRTTAMAMTITTMTQDSQDISLHNNIND
jgi:amidophosphoribosyltransferase